MRIEGTQPSARLDEGVPGRAGGADPNIRKIAGETGERGTIPKTTYVATDVKNAALTVVDQSDRLGGRVVQEIFVPESARGKGVGQRLYMEALRDGPLLERSQFRSKEATRAVDALIKKGSVKRVVRDDKTFLEIDERPQPPGRLSEGVSVELRRPGVEPTPGEASIHRIVARRGLPETAGEITTREDAPERDGASDFEAADEAERALERSIDDPSQIDAKAEADELEANMREDSGLSERADSGQDAVAKADSYGKAARAAALCLSRKP